MEHQRTVRDASSGWLVIHVALWEAKGMRAVAKYGENSFPARCYTKAFIAGNNELARRRLEVHKRRRGQ